MRSRFLSRKRLIYGGNNMGIFKQFSLEERITIQNELSLRTSFKALAEQLSRSSCDESEFQDGMNQNFCSIKALPRISMAAYKHIYSYILQLRTSYMLAIQKITLVLPQKMRLTPLGPPIYESSCAADNHVNGCLMTYQKILYRMNLSKG